MFYVLAKTLAKLITKCFVVGYKKLINNQTFDCVCLHYSLSYVTCIFFKKMGQPQPLFHLFSVFSNQQNNFYNKYM